jgi:DNA-binding transcriptional regulator YhcF (GntR family)
MIETDILRGILLEEERVPSTNELAKHYTINPATAAKGINLLVDEGVLYKKRGIGMFVSTGAKAMIIEKRKAVFYDNYVRSLLEEARSLGISTEQLINMIRENKSSNEEDRP